MGNPRGKFPWEIPVERPREKFPCEIPVGNSRVKFPWGTPVGNSRGKFPFEVPVPNPYERPRGKHCGHSCAWVTIVSGTFVAHLHTPITHAVRHVRPNS